MLHSRLLADRLARLASGDAAVPISDPADTPPADRAVAPGARWAAGIVHDGPRTASGPRVASEAPALAAPSAAAVADGSPGPIAAWAPSILDVPAPTAAPPAASAAAPATASAGHVNDVVDAAMHGPQARADTGETGAGITIGILSDSFNLRGQLAAEQADGDLPANVDILKDNATGGDEGMAMAEIIHSIAPGASIEFYTAFGSEADFASGITALVNAGSDIIVDDVSYYDEPFYQNAGPITLAAEAAVQQGVSYFTAAANSGDNYYEAAYSGVSHVDLPGISGESSVHEVIIDGKATPYIPINVAINAELYFSLEWTQPFASTGGHQGSAYGIGVAFYDASGNLLQTNNMAENFANPDAVGADPVVTGALDNTSASTGISVVFYQNAGTMPANTVSTFKLDFIDDFLAPVTGSLLGSGSGSVAGHAEAPGVDAVNAISYSDMPADGGSGAPADFDSTGPGAEYYDSAGQSVAGPNLATPVSDGEPAFLAPDGNSTGVTGFATFTGTSAAAPAAAAVAALLLQADPSLTPAQITQILKSTATPDAAGPSDIVGAGTLNADAATLDALSMAACYLRGTRIATPAGDRPIEELAIGDLVLTAAGAAKPIRWIGRRSYAGRMLAGRPHLLPVTIRAGALGRGLPRRDLRISPRHAMLVDGVLAPAATLVNDATIVQEPGYERVDYIHIELATHDAILAEGAPSETFMNSEGRALFQNAAEYAALYPGANGAPLLYCAPCVDDGPIIESIRGRLALATAA